LSPTNDWWVTIVSSILQWFCRFYKCFAQYDSLSNAQNARKGQIVSFDINSMVGIGSIKINHGGGCAFRTIDKLIAFGGWWWAKQL